MINPFAIDPLLLYAIPLFGVSIWIETAVRRHAGLPRYDGGDSWASIGLGLGSGIISTFTKVVAFVIMLKLYAFRVFTLPLAWWSIALLVIGDDLSYYLHHLSCHRVRLFWAAHVNHHSSRQFTFTTALRQGWGEWFHKYVWWMWLPLVGFHPLWIVSATMCNLVYNFFLHTEAVPRLPGPIEAIFNTPNHHRVHHGANAHYLDRNLGGIFIVWDRLFGTFQKELPGHQTVFGLTKNIHTNNVFTIATHEYASMMSDVRRARSLRDKLMYVLGPPGWQPEHH